MINSYNQRKVNFCTFNKCVLLFLVPEQTLEHTSTLTNVRATNCNL